MSTMSRANALELDRLLRAAEALPTTDRIEGGVWVGHAPEVYALIRFIAGRPWCDPDYLAKHEAAQRRMDAGRATLADVQVLLTAFYRADRFSDSAGPDVRSGRVRALVDCAIAFVTW